MSDFADGAVILFVFVMYVVCVLWTDVFCFINQ